MFLGPRINNMWTVLFDIDGTLIRTNGAGMGAMGQAVVEHYGKEDIPEIRVHGCTDKGIVSELFTKLDISLEADQAGFMQTYFDLLKTSLKKTGGEILPGVADLLEVLNGHSNVALGLLTGNAKRAAEIKLDHFGLREYFLFGGYGDDFSDRNDVAAIAVNAARKYLKDRFDPSKVWVIGDTLNDIRCARSVNAKVIAVETGGDNNKILSEENPDLLMRDLSEVSHWVNSLDE